MPETLPLTKIRFTIEKKNIKLYINYLRKRVIPWVERNMYILYAVNVAITYCIGSRSLLYLFCSFDGTNYWSHHYEAPSRLEEKQQSPSFRISLSFQISFHITFSCSSPAVSRCKKENKIISRRKLTRISYR